MLSAHLHMAERLEMEIHRYVMAQLSSLPQAKQNKQTRMHNERPTSTKQKDGPSTSDLRLVLLAIFLWIRYRLSRLLATRKIGLMGSPSSEVLGDVFSLKTVIPSIFW